MSNINYTYYDNFLIPEAFISAIESGDFSGLFGDEVGDVNLFLNSLPDAQLFWEWEETPFLSFENDVTPNSEYTVVEASLWVK